MSISSITTLFLIGALAGMLATLSAMAVLIGAYVKVPGGKAVRYWAGGSSLILIGVTQIMLQEDQVNFFVGMLSCAIFIAGHVYQWRGLQIFFFKPHTRSIWPKAGAFLLLYAFPLLGGASQIERLAFVALVPLLVWPLCLKDLLKAGQRPYQFSTWLAITGLLTMLVGAAAELLLGLLPSLFSFILASRDILTLIDTMVPILGSLMYLAALILLYFERAAAQANHAATHDELTGLLNRRAIIAGGEHEIERARRHKHSLVVAFADIDFFKKINDTYGHDAGDLALKEVAKVLMQTCRTVDLVGRYGGEEFCLVFPGDHHGGAELIGQRIVEAVRSHHFAGLPQVTISVGLALLPVDNLSHTWHSLVQQADIELYKAKQNGRDGYSIYGKEFKKATRSMPVQVQAVLPLQRGKFFFLGRP